MYNDKKKKWYVYKSKKKQHRTIKNSSTVVWKYIHLREITVLVWRNWILKSTNWCYQQKKHLPNPWSLWVISWQEWGLCGVFRVSVDTTFLIRSEAWSDELLSQTVLYSWPSDICWVLHCDKSPAPNKHNCCLRNNYTTGKKEKNDDIYY